MKKLYNDTHNRTLKGSAINGETGEMFEINLEERGSFKKYPVRGSRGVYLKQIEDIVNLGKPAQKMFFAVADEVDEFNIYRGKWIDTGSKTINSKDSSYIGKIKRELESNGFIYKVNKKYMVNPFIVLPVFDKNIADQHWKAQQIWKHFTEDKDIWYEGIHEDTKGM